LTDKNNDSVSPFVVGVSGHRDLHPEALPHLRDAVAAILTQLKDRLPDSELRLIAGMAAGADLLVAQIALELGFSVDALLPMPLAQYAADFDAESFELLETLLAHPRVACHELPLSVPEQQSAAAAGNSHRDASYSTLTQALVRGCSLLIALWDGESSRLPGGTADTVLRYLGVRTDRNKDDDRIEFSDSLPEHDLPARLVYWIPAVRAKSAFAPITAEPCFLAGLGDNALQALTRMPRGLEDHLHSLNIYNREYQHLQGRWGAPAVQDSLMSALPATLTVPPREIPALKRIDAQYGKADALALYFQRRSDRLFIFFNLVAFTMGLAYVAYERFTHAPALLFVYLLILTSSVAVYYVFHERRWFAKHLMCRALAETLRVKFYLRLAHGDHLVDAERVLSLSGIDRFNGFGWIGHVLTGVESPAAGEQRAGDAQRDAVDLAWIENQRRYFARKVAALHRSGVRTKWLRRILFGIILAVIVLLLLLGQSASERVVLGLPVQESLKFILGLIAVMLASWELHQNKMATRELLWQYRNQLKHFSRARAQLARTFGASRRLEVLAELGKDSLMESYLWTIHRFHREHEPPGPA
jgi:hypothetical protein